MKTRIAVAAACATIAWMPAPVRAATGGNQQFPERPVRFIVPTTPSGGVDFVARLMAQRLGERWGQAVVVDNRAGASGLIAFEIFARAAPDGHTLIMANPAHMLTAQRSGKLSFEHDGDFSPLALPAVTPLLLVAYPGVAVRSVKELVELAKAKPRDISYASSGTGGASHLGVALFASIARIELTHVPYKGTPASYSDLMSGRVQLSLTSVAGAILHVQTGRLRALAIAGTKRVPSLLEVPTFAESGYPGYEWPLWYMVFAPARMPAPLMTRLNADLNAIVQRPDVADRFIAAGIEPVGRLSPAEVADYSAKALVTWNDALKAAGIR